MNGDRANTAESGGIDWLRPLRYLWRVPVFALHVLISLPITLALISTGRARRLANGETQAHRAIRWWSNGACRIFGIRVSALGDPAPHPALLVANHVSWMDIEVIHSQRAVGFVAKSEIRRWQLVGFMAAMGETVFHQRGCGSSLERVVNAITERLEGGHSVAIFPESRTGPGDRVLPFHGRLLAAAVTARCPVQPVAIRFHRHGQRNASIPFAPDENFVVNVLRVLGDAPSEAEVHSLEPIIPDGQGRRDMANRAREEIAEIVDA
jgi:1-acyl-sn-glycerol-3-phosphate acyltransferase